MQPLQTRQTRLHISMQQPAGQAAEMPVTPTTNVFLFGESVARAHSSRRMGKRTLLTSMCTLGGAVTVELATEKTKGKAIGQVRTCTMSPNEAVSDLVPTLARVTSCPRPGALTRILFSSTVNVDSGGIALAGTRLSGSSNADGALRQWRGGA